MDIKYSDLFLDDENKDNDNLNINQISDLNSLKNNINNNNNKQTELLGKKSTRENEFSNLEKNITNKKNKNKKKNKNSKQEIKNKDHNNKLRNITLKKHANDLYFLDNNIKISTISKYDFTNSNKSKYQDLLGDKKSILKIQEFIYDSHNTNTIINYKVITQIKTINFKTDNNLFQKGKQKKEINDEKFNIGQSLVEAGSMPSMGFWNQRYYYFSKFDQGIQLDYESIIV